MPDTDPLANLREAAHAYFESCDGACPHDEGYGLLEGKCGDIAAWLSRAGVPLTQPQPDTVLREALDKYLAYAPIGHERLTTDEVEPDGRCYRCTHEGRYEGWHELHALRAALRAAPAAPQPDTAPSHPSPGESAGFDAEVAALAAIIHARNDHFPPTCDGCRAMAEHLTAFGYRVQPDAALTVERLYRVIADTAWDEATSWVGDPVDGIEQHDLYVLAAAILRALGEGE